ncbi:MAG: SDR family NAD(P)-dependent oxidoreductase [Bacteroidales bacterium]|jgi:short-subunit dehydrogenase|nr:SDR family NAD(P)-dependent oxidoreductase [Bacteroidales bacterium]
MKVKDKKIIVTGGGSGIGRSLVLELLSRGASVIALDINRASLDETSELAGDKKNSLTCMVLDITDRSGVQEFARQQAVEDADGLINNAGIIQPFKKLGDLTQEEIDRVVNVNFCGTLCLTRSMLPILKSRKEAHLVNISSMGGFLPVPGQTVYGGAKAAVKLITEGLHSEMRDTSVRVTIVFPGAVNTNIMENSGLQTARTADAEKQAGKILSAGKAAEIIIDGMEKDRYRVLVGKDAKMMDILYRLSPRLAAGFIAKQMKRHLSV